MLKRGGVIAILVLWIIASALPNGIQVNGDEENIVKKVDGSVVKICQLIGDFDRERNQSTISQTFTKYGVAGTDLGISFEHNGKLVFLFGDTVGRSAAPLSGKDDSFAYTVDENPDDGLELVFYTGTPSISGKPRFLPPMVSGVSQSSFEVPVEGVDVDGVAYVYFTTNHTKEKVMGSSILARLDEATLSFTFIYTFSSDKFINVHVAVVNNSQLLGLPEASGRGLLIWGSGEYRKSDPYLAYMPLESIEDKSAIRYFKGLDNQKPIWSTSEADATPLFHDPIVGEFSVAWNQYLGRWIMLYDGVFMRSSIFPWGPWSSRQVLFNTWRDGGYGHFIHWPGRDNVSDPGREWQFGGAYGAYLIDRFTKGSDGKSTVYFTLSTWNPYTVVLMKAELEVEQVSGSQADENMDQTTIDPLNQSTSFKNQGQPPTQVSLQTPEADAVAERSVLLVWSENEDEDFDKYEIYRAGSLGSLGVLVATVTDQKHVSYEVTGLSPGTVYYFTVRTVDTEGLHSDSNQISVRTNAQRIPVLVILLPVFIAVIIIIIIVLLLTRRKPSLKIPPPPPS